MKNAKLKRILEEKRQRFESQVAAAEKLLNGIPAEIRAALARILTELGVQPYDIAGGNLSLRLDRKSLSVLTSRERNLFGSWVRATLDKVEDECELKETELLLHPRPGRGKGSKNKQAKPPDPAIEAALSEWEDCAKSFGSKPASERAITLKLARKHCRVKTREAIAKFAERLRKARKKAKKARYRRLAEAMA